MNRVSGLLPRFVSDASSGVLHLSPFVADIGQSVRISPLMIERRTKASRFPQKRKVLESKGLLQSRSRVGTQVLDVRRGVRSFREGRPLRMSANLSGAAHTNALRSRRTVSVCAVLGGRAKRGRFAYFALKLTVCSLCAVPFLSLFRGVRNN